MQVTKVAAAYEACALHEAAEGAMNVAVRANKFVDDRAPWTSFKKVQLSCLTSLRLLCVFAMAGLYHLTGCKWQSVRADNTYVH